MFRVNRSFNWSICGDRHMHLQGYLQRKKGAQFNQKKDLTQEAEYDRSLKCSHYVWF